MKRQKTILSLSFHLRTAWLHRIFLLKSAAIGLFLGLLVSLLLPKEYEARMLTAAESTAIPEDETLGNLATGGIAVESPARYDALRPSLYPQIFASAPFLDSLSRIPVQTSDGLPDSALTLRAYLEQQHFRLSTPSTDDLIDETSVFPLHRRMTLLTNCGNASPSCPTKKREPSPSPAGCKTRSSRPPCSTA